MEDTTYCISPPWFYSADSADITTVFSLLKSLIAPTNQSFPKSPKNCDIIFLNGGAATTYRHDSADIFPKIVLDIVL
jgi:hypothetical protein